MATAFHVVMLSASLKRTWTRPPAPVSNAGCHNSVSGKYSRNRGVDVGRRGLEPDIVITSPTDAAAVARILDDDTVTSTEVFIEATCKVTTTRVIAPARTNTPVRTFRWKPGSEARTW